MKVPRAQDLLVLAAMVSSIMGCGYSFGGEARRSDETPLQDSGAIIRGPVQEKKIALVFTGYEFAEGADEILSALEEKHARASFFFTGAFLSNTNFAPVIQRVVRGHHYLGPHSDQHLLYCSWDSRQQLLVSHDQFQKDLEANLKKIEQAGFERGNARFFLPPYEYYNSQIADWTKQMGLQLVNFTPGTRSNADYTGESEKNFVPSRAIFKSIVAKEKEDPNGLNGFLLLLHVGSGPARADKFHEHFRGLLKFLGDKGYQFVRVDELLRPMSSR